MLKGRIIGSATRESTSKHTLLIKPQYRVVVTDECVEGNEINPTVAPGFSRLYPAHVV